MRKLHLVGVCPKRWKTTTLINHADAYPADAAKRVWDTGTLNAVWVGDITYLRTWEGWLYLATVIDACSRRVIGWAIAEHMRTDLVEDALKMAITLRGELPEQVVFHTDRGTQYASEQITLRAANRAHPVDGLHRDLLGQRDGRIVLRDVEDRVLLPAGVADQEAGPVEVGAWIEDRYNRRRRHASIGQISPVTFELQNSNQTADLQQAA